MQRTRLPLAGSWTTDPAFRPHSPRSLASQLLRCLLAGLPSPSLVIVKISSCRISSRSQSSRALCSISFYPVSPSVHESVLTQSSKNPTLVSCLSLRRISAFAMQQHSKTVYLGEGTAHDSAERGVVDIGEKHPTLAGGKGAAHDAREGGGAPSEEVRLPSWGEGSARAPRSRDTDGPALILHPRSSRSNHSQSNRSSSSSSSSPESTDAPTPASDHARVYDPPGRRRNGVRSGQ